MMTWIVPIISNVLVAGLIASLAWLAGRSDRRAALAHLLWIAFFVKLISPPLVPLPVSVPNHWFASLTLDRPDSNPSLASSAAKADAGSVPSPSAVAFSASSAPESTSAIPDWLNPSFLVLAAWAIGFVYCLTRGVIRFLRFHKLLQREGCADEEAGRYVASLIERSSGDNPHRRRVPKVLRIPLRISPMLFGFGHRAVIVCPEMLWKSLSEIERRAFLAHETAHYCRGDHWVRWMEFLVTAIYWWFPLVYFARHQLERHEEACCDEWAVRILNSSPRQYADSLLKVVDFISDHHVRFPRLASAMRPTNSLEMRLRLVMQIGKHPAESRSTRIGFAIAGVSLLLVHPFPQPAVTADEGTTSRLPRKPLSSPSSELALPSFESPQIETPVLPPAPQGFWNRMPERRWADISLTLPGVELRADVARGITIETREGNSLRFSADELRAIVEIPGSRRVVIGSRDGSVRLWDLDAGTAVSLLGRHPQEITSLAYHENGGLVSADAAGSVMRWDMQSGRVLATSSVPASSVQSIRFSTDGRSLAVLTGRWNTALQAQHLFIVDSETLQATQERRLSRRVALVVAASDGRWNSIDWTGNVRDLESEAEIGQIPKRQVSAMLLSQNISLPTTLNDTGN
jgi:beta-lactamase regulating signal transducer with metallopeptidase domain